MVFDLHAENVNKISTASRFFVIKNKIKNPRPASNFLGRPAKPVINFTWPKTYLCFQARWKRTDFASYKANCNR